MPWSFETSRQRIRRAQAHRMAIGERWNALIEEKLYDAFLYIDDDGTGSLQVRPIYRPEVMDEFSLLVGEFLYQLMAALDACVYKAAIIDSGQSPPPKHKHLYFPICNSHEKFKEAGNKIAPLASKRRDIIEAMQPYNAPELAAEGLVFNFNRAFGILGEWAIIDRHRKLHVTGSWASNARPKFRCPDGTRIENLRVTASGLLEHESEVASFKLLGYTRGMKVEGNPDIAIDLAVDESPPPCADTDSLGNRLLAMEKAASIVVRQFEGSFI
jgi:hypothetical protein